MQKIRILNKSGLFTTMEWSYIPAENLEANNKSLLKLQELNIDNAIVYEVAPDCFWYSTPEEKINCSVY